MDGHWRTVESDCGDWDHTGLLAERLLVFINGSGHVTVHREVIHLVSVQRVVPDDYPQAAFPLLALDSAQETAFSESGNPPHEAPRPHFVKATSRDLASIISTTTSHCHLERQRFSIMPLVLE
jgi:hypothetical protein